GNTRTRQVRIKIISPNVRIQIAQEPSQIDFPTSKTLVAIERFFSFSQPLGLVVNEIQIERFARRQNDVGIAGNESIGARVRIFGLFQNADPFDVTDLIAANDNTIGVANRGAIAGQHGQITVGVEAPIAVEVNVETEIKRRF